MANGIEDMNVFIIKKWLQNNHTSLLVVVVMISTLYQSHKLGGSIEELTIEVRNNTTAIHGLTSDVSGLKADVSGLKADVNQLQLDVKNNAKNINILTGKVDILIKNDYQNHQPAPASTALSPS